MIKVRDITGKICTLSTMPPFRLAEVLDVNSTGVQLAFTGDSELNPRPKRYKRIVSTLTNGDTVLVARVGDDSGGTDIIIGKVE